MLTLLLSLALVTKSSALLQLPAGATETLTVTVAGEGVAVVIIPGLAGSAFAFRRLTPVLAAGGHRVIIIEPLGMGTSSRPEKADYTLEAQAARIAAVLDTLGIEKAMVVGHALGGSIALRLVLARPDLVSEVVLVEGGAAEQAATPGFRRAMVFVPWIKMMGGGALVRRQLRKSLAKSSADPGWITDEVLDGYSRGVTKNLDATLRGYLRIAEAHDRNALGPRLRQVNVPVLLVLGAAPHDAGPSAEEVERLSAGLPFFSVQRVGGAGHHIHEERPCELAALIELFGAPRP